MIKATPPSNEAKRIASLEKMRLFPIEQEEVFDRITRVTQRIFNVPVVFISVLTHTDQWLKSKIGHIPDQLPIENTICGHVLQHGETLVINDIHQDARFSGNTLLCDNLKIRFYAGRPLHNTDGFIVGTLCVIDHQPRSFDAEERILLDDLAEWVESIYTTHGLSIALDDLMVELDEVRRESLMDPLLNIWNRGAIMAILQRESKQAERHKNTLTVLMVDVDFFKRVNDTYGHHAGDMALIGVVKALRQGLRAYDSLGRYGGEEFLILLPNNHRDNALKSAERLRSLVENTVIPFEDIELKCTVSIGVAVADFSAGKPDVEQALIAADLALLRAKANGRNRIELADTDAAAGRTVVPGDH